MKTNLFLLSTIVIVALSSCNNLDTTTPSIEKYDSSFTPSIIFKTQSTVGSVTRIDGSNTSFFKDIPSDDAVNFNVIVETNVPVITAEGFCRGPQVLACSVESESGGTRNLAVERLNGVPEYTVDNSFTLIQPVSNDRYYEFAGYGPIETYFNFRVRGSKGTAYVDLSEAGIKDWDKNHESRQYYALGQIKEISEVSATTKTFKTMSLFANVFSEWKYNPTNVYDADEVVLTISTESGDVTVPVYGKTRDNEIKNLLAKIKVGDTIEVPVLSNNKDDLAKGKLNEIMALEVLEK